jgi:arylsulfatase A-like enzyme
VILLIDTEKVLLFETFTLNKGLIIKLMRYLIKSTCATLLFSLIIPTMHGESSRPPNIVIIISDDQGYADHTFNPQHAPEINTPNLDALARNSISFSQAYISGNVCSPSRLGLLTGRYQQRCGVYTAGEGGKGVALESALCPTLFPTYIKPAGYTSMAFGKWHLGLEVALSPAARGFDDFYGFLGRGGHDYYKLSDTDNPMYRGLKPISDSGYLTTRLAEEAVKFIQDKKANPFFVYLAFNAVHSPAEAPEEDIARIRAKFPTLTPERAILAAMIEHLDHGVGSVIKALKDEGLYDDTLLFFLTDNGGSKSMQALNTPLRGFKQEHYEGGIRTPFFVSWPKRFAGGRVIDTPVISLDILPTVMAAANLPLPTTPTLDGENILPLIEGKADPKPRNFFWSEGGETGEWAVRSDNWKLIGFPDRQELYNLATDPYEKNNTIKDNAGQATALYTLYDNWLTTMATPMKGGSKKWVADSTGNKKHKKKKKEE